MGYNKRANSIGRSQLSSMCRQFAIALKTGWPPARATRLIAAQTQNRRLRGILELVAADVSSGFSLARSFETRGDLILPLVLVETLRAGEASGELEASFLKLSEYFDSGLSSARRVKSVMTRPALLLLAALFSIVLVLAVAMPVFLRLFERYGLKLPGSTLSLVAIYGAVSGVSPKNWLIVLVIIAGLAIALMFLSKTKGGHNALLTLTRRLPIFGALLEKHRAAQFAGTMALLCESGLEPRVAAEACESLFSCRALPLPLSQTMAVSGGVSPEDTLSVTGEYYAVETEAAAERANGLTLPIIMAVLGAVMAFIIIALYLPLFNIG